MSEAFLKVVNMSISAGWLVLAVLAIRLILKKAPKWVNILLWGIVAIRLICPFSIESALSLIPSTETISPEIMMDWTPEISTGIAPLDQVVNPVISTSFAPHPCASANPLQILIPVAANLWLLGVIIMLAYTVISYLSLRRKLRTAVILRSNIFQCESVSSPFVLGILKPRIYLPYSMDGKNLDHVVAHEQAHIRRLDHWWKPLGFLLLTVYWFNPLTWVAYILLCRDIELACDEKVIAELGNEQRADYTQALVACAVNRRMIAACPLAFGEVGVKDRVKSIMNYRKPTFWIIMTALVVCVVVAVCFLTDPNPSREFSMTGNNVSDLNSEIIVDRILDVEDWDASNVYVYADNFSLLVDSDFNWVNSQAIRYFFSNSEQNYSAQLRIFPDEGKYFLTEPSEWNEVKQIFLMRHYLNAIKYLPQEAIRQMAPADQYIIQHVANGRPSDYEQVITYSSDGVQETTGWYIHLQIQPLRADGEGYSGSGDEVIELFYGESSKHVTKRFDLEPITKVDVKINLRNLHNGTDTLITDQEAIEAIVAFISQVEGVNPTSSKEYYGGSFEVQIIFEDTAIFSIGFGDDESFNYGDFGDGYPARYALQGITRDEVIRFFSQYDSSGFNWRLPEERIRMIPTDTDLLGCPAGALLVPIDGNVYRYELTEGNPDHVTIDELMYTFTEETHIEGIVWEVYSLKEYPDKTAVLMLSGTNSAWLCEYSPPKRCSDTALADAMNAGYVIMEDGIATHGQDIWQDFYERTQQGKAASVTVVHYFTLDPQRCDSAYYEVYSQDYPCLYECYLEYDGKTFTLTEPDGNNVRIRNFEYLMKYDNTEFYSQSSKTPGRRFDYVLTHDHQVTWEQIWNGLVSSYTGADIDHYSIYSEREY